MRRLLAQKNMSSRLHFSRDGCNKYKAIVAKCKKEISNYHEKRENDLTKNGYVVKFYSYVNKLIKHKPKMIPIRNLDDNFKNLHREKCNIFNAFLRMCLL